MDTLWERRTLRSGTSPFPGVRTANTGTKKLIVESDGSALRR